jgi:hypothetical protein
MVFFFHHNQLFIIKEKNETHIKQFIRRGEERYP